MASKSTNLRSQLEDLNITRDELDQIGEALKKEEFRKLLNNYFEEVTNPENQKVYENEITQLEKERGVDVTFIHPAAGYVIKTSVDGKKKAFINICQNENIGKPVAKRETGGVRWSVPHSLAPPRDDLDKNKNFCIVYDVVFHPEAIRMANSNKPFKQLVNDTALNAIEDSYKVALDKKNLIYPKIPFKGLKRPTVIRKKSKCPPTPSEDSDQGIFDLPNYPYAEPPEEVEVKSSELPTNKDESPYTVPKYIIKQRSNIEMQDFTNSMTSKMNAAIPSALVVEIDLPLIKSAVDVNLDVSEKSLCLSSEKPAKYKLDVNLPYAVLEGEGSAKFDSRTKKLVVTLSVKRRHTTPNLQQLSREDSGVDSESRSTESSSDDELSKCDGDKPPVIVEVISGGENKQTIDESDETAYRTSIVEHFLSSDIAYSLPSYKCNNVDNLLAFTFHVKNVEPESVDHVFLERSCGVHLKFKSMGAGCFPSHYAFCVKFPGELSVDSDSLSIEVWDNNVIAQLRLIGCDSNSTLTDYLCGKSEEELEKKAFDLPVAVLKLSQESKLANEKKHEKEDIKVEVLKNEKELKSIKITHTKPSAVQSANESLENKVQLDDKSTEKAIDDELIKALSSKPSKCDKPSSKPESDERKGVKKCDKTAVNTESDKRKGVKKCEETTLNSETLRSKEVKKCDKTTANSETDRRKSGKKCHEAKNSESEIKSAKKCDKITENSESEKRKESTKTDESAENSEFDKDKDVKKCDKIAENSEPVPILKYDGKGSPAKRCTFSDRPPLVHALSESLNDGAESMKPRFRGILKVGRSLSESNVDDYHWSEDGGEGGEKVKKTVRFNNAISKKTFRRNSCILDQRKKNQRKSRNKKRAQQRRASESETSECETDKADLDDLNICVKVDDDTETSETSASETQSESDDGLKKPQNDEMSLSRRNPHKKGKKKSARKSASTAKMHFSNNLMFELDA